MSMNLGCEEMELWETPTYISYMCLCVGKNKNGRYIVDKDWKAIRFRYIEWVNSSEFDKKMVKEHIEKLMSFKKIHFLMT